MQRKSFALNGFIGAVVVALGVVGYTSLGRIGAAPTTTSTATVKRGVVLSSVSATGNVLAQSQLEVNFDSSASSNVVTQITVKPGDKVAKGQTLAKVDDRTAQLALAGAQASLASAQAQLDKLRNGLTPQELAQDQATLDQSGLSVDSAAAAVDNAVATAAQNAITTATTVSQAQQALVNASASADHDLSVLQAAVDQAKAKNDAAALATAQAALATGQLKDQQSVQSAQNAVTNAQNSQATGALKDSQAIDGAKRQYATAQAQYNSAAAGNAVKEKPPAPADLAQQQAAVANATNQLATAQKNLDATTLVAPVSATVAAVNGKLGVSASSSSAGSSSNGGSSNSGASSSSSSSGSGFVSLTDLSALQVKVGFSEADAAKVKAGQAATITFDALTSVSLTGTVQSVDNASTLVSNVVTYYAYVALDSSPAATPVKVGMTASVQVVVSKADNVLLLPATAISARGTNATVSIQTGATTKDTQSRQITLGLKGDQSVEISSGLADGDKIVVTRTSGTGSTGANAARLAGAGATTGAGGLGGGGIGGGGFVGGGAGGGGRG
jgi:multidrug efflux pump subunit AcrA (membrane-fusion protein)